MEVSERECVGSEQGKVKGKKSVDDTSILYVSMLASTKLLDLIDHQKNHAGRSVLLANSMFIVD